MRYALNVTPINGWETHLAQGAQSLALSAQAAGTSAALGSGTAAQSLTTSATGRLTIYSAGATALALTADGTGYALKSATAKADMRLTSSGNSTRGYGGYGSVALMLRAAYGIPVNPIHTGFITNKTDRTMALAGEAAMLVPAREAAMRVSADADSIAVPRDNRRA